MRLTIFVLAALIARAVHAQPTQPQSFEIRVHVASITLNAIHNSALPKLELGVPKYISGQEFTNVYQTDWSKRSGADFLSMAPVRIEAGEAYGLDLTDNSFLTNQAKTPIPRDKTGLFLRFEADKSALPLQLKCQFVYNSKNADGAIARKGNYSGALNFTNDVAIIRLPQLTEEIVTQRRILGLPAGKKTAYDTRQLFIVFDVAQIKTRN